MSVVVLMDVDYEKWREERRPEDPFTCPTHEGEVLPVFDSVDDFFAFILRGELPHRGRKGTLRFPG
jgi:hypothetical protein